MIVRSRRSFKGGLDFNTCKFLFVRQDRIGDVLISTPLFEVVKRHYPGAIVDALLSSNNHFVLQNDPCIRKRWIYDKRLVSSWKLLRDVRRERYDFVIDLMDNPSATSTIICLLSGARWTVGLEKENDYVYDIVVPLLSRRDSHIVDRIAQLLVPFNINPDKEQLRIRYNISNESQDFARAIFKRSELLTRNTIGINISAGHDVRFWGVDNFRKLIELLRERHRQRRFLILSKPAHHGFAEQIAHGFPDVTLGPTTDSFDRFAGLVSMVSLLITPDTSAVHLAAAFGIPAVVLYVQSDKNLRVWDPYRSRSEILIADIDDLRVILPEAVAEAVGRLLRPNRRSRHKQSRVAPAHA